MCLPQPGHSPEIWLSLLALSIYESELHVSIFCVAAPRVGAMQRHRATRYGNSLILEYGCDRCGHNRRESRTELELRAMGDRTKNRRDVEPAETTLGELIHRPGGPGGDRGGSVRGAGGGAGPALLADRAGGAPRLPAWQSASDAHGAGRQRGAECLRPSRWIREASVVGFIPRSSAAPPAP
jgi:hypothetical protein